METRIYEPVRHVFTDEEIRRLGEALARETQTLYELRVQKSGAMAALAAQIKNSDKLIGELTTKITQRYEMVDIEVVALMDTPKPGMKAFVPINDPDPDKAIRYEPMTLAEMQANFSFGFNDDEPDGKSKGAGEK